MNLETTFFFFNILRNCFISEITPLTFALELIGDYAERHSKPRSGGEWGRDLEAGRIFTVLLDLVNVYSFLGLHSQFLP